MSKDPANLIPDPDAQAEDLTAAATNVRMTPLVGATDDPTGDKTRGGALSSSESYEDFLRTEHSNIAAAHFNSTTTITSFFQYYLLIVSLPATAASLFIRFDETVLQRLAEPPYCFMIPLLLFTIALVGLCVMAYIVNLRLDALFYARTVNGVRRYFVERSGLRRNEIDETVVLPTRTDTPPYYEPTFFGFVVGAFALFDSAYLVVGSISLWPMIAWMTSDWLFYASMATSWLLGVLLHFLLYWYLTRRRSDLSTRDAPHGTMPASPRPPKATLR